MSRHTEHVQGAVQWAMRSITKPCDRCHPDAKATVRPRPNTVELFGMCR